MARVKRCLCVPVFLFSDLKGKIFPGAIHQGDKQIILEQRINVSVTVPLPLPTCLPRDKKTLFSSPEALHVYIKPGDTQKISEIIIAGGSKDLPFPGKIVLQMDKGGGEVRRFVDDYPGHHRPQ
jgi:hypothetical protein